MILEAINNDGQDFYSLKNSKFIKASQWQDFFYLFEFCEEVVSYEVKLLSNGQKICVLKTQNQRELIINLILTKGDNQIRVGFALNANKDNAKIRFCEDSTFHYADELNQEKLNRLKTKYAKAKTALAMSYKKVAA